MRSRFSIGQTVGLHEGGEPYYGTVRKIEITAEGECVFLSLVPGHAWQGHPADTLTPVAVSWPAVAHASADALGDEL